jgi:NAD-dependent SIR2 family protein deacetylase
VIVNREPTPLDELADAVVHGEAGTLLPALVDAAVGEPG